MTASGGVSLPPEKNFKKTLAIGEKVCYTIKWRFMECRNF